MIRRLLAVLISLALLATSGGLAEAALAAPGVFALPSDLPQFRLQPPEKLGRVTDYFSAGRVGDEASKRVSEQLFPYSLTRPIA